jgi:hypothetical protein
MEQSNTMAMEFNGLTEVVAAIISGTGGVFGGLKLGRSKQIEELKEVVSVYVEAHNFTKAEAADLRKGIEESREHNKKCEEDLQCVREELAEVKGVVLRHMGVPPKPRK